ncbi:lymphotactin-like [Heteronotia binoei]|uniref:lymphotactin-like n=1 Tax=Heteronotia binoei TaxID=13085 RepID=UPI00292EECF6|nr:lymphotactin-like [Heteronotia binoei]
MKHYVAAILAISFLDIFNEGIVRGSFGSQMMPRNQCEDLHLEEIDIRRISSYEEHETPFKAVILVTKNGFRICVPHNLQWVKNAIRNLDQRPKPKVPKKRKSSSRRKATSTSRPKRRTN